MQELAGGSSAGVGSRMNDILRQSQELRERSKGLMRGGPSHAATPTSSAATPPQALHANGMARGVSPTRAHPPPPLGTPPLHDLPSPYNMNISALGGQPPPPPPPPPLPQHHLHHPPLPGADLVLSATAAPRVSEMVSFHRASVERYEERILELEAELHTARDEVRSCEESHTALLGQLQDVKAQLLAGKLPPPLPQHDPPAPAAPDSGRLAQRDDAIAELTDSLKQRKREVESLQGQLQASQQDVKEARAVAAQAQALPAESRAEVLSILADYEHLVEEMGRIRSELRGSLEAQGVLRTQLGEKDRTIQMLSAEMESRQSKESTQAASASSLRNESAYLRSQAAELQRIVAQKEAKASEAERCHYEKLLEKDRAAAQLKEENASLNERVVELGEKLRDLRGAKPPGGGGDGGLAEAERAELASLRAQRQELQQQLQQQHDARGAELRSLRSQNDDLLEENADLTRQVSELEGKIGFLSASASHSTLRDWGDRVYQRAEASQEQLMQTAKRHPDAAPTTTPPEVPLEHPGLPSGPHTPAEEPLDPPTAPQSGQPLVVPQYGNLGARCERVPYETFVLSTTCSISGLPFCRDVRDFVAKHGNSGALQGALRSLLTVQEEVIRTARSGRGLFVAPILYAGTATYLMPSSPGEPIPREVVVLTTEHMLYLMTIGSSVLRCVRLDCLQRVISAKVSKAKPAFYKVGLKLGTPSGAWGVTSSDAPGPDVLLTDVEKQLLETLRTIAEAHFKLRKKDASTGGIGGLFAGKKGRSHHEAKDERSVEKDLVLSGVVPEAVHGNREVVCLGLAADPSEAPQQQQQQQQQSPVSLQSSPAEGGGFSGASSASGGGGGKLIPPEVPEFDVPASPTGLPSAAMSGFSQESFSPKYRQATPDAYHLDQQALGGEPKKNSAPPPPPAPAAAASSSSSQRKEAKEKESKGPEKSPAATVFLCQPGAAPQHCSINYPMKFSPDAFLKGMAEHFSSRIGEAVQPESYMLHLAPAETPIDMLKTGSYATCLSHSTLLKGTSTTLKEIMRQGSRDTTRSARHTLFALVHRDLEW